MNHVYRTVFNRALGVWQVAVETAKRHGKGGGRAARRVPGLSLIALLPLAASSAAWAALPAVGNAAMHAGGAAGTHASGPASPSPSTLPSGGQVVAGSGAIAGSGNAMTIRQHSQNLAINWQSFNIGKDASVTFVQPNSQAIALNRVLGSDGTQILGQLKGNGQVWVLNPNGVLFGRSAQVSVGGLVASTLGLSDADFLAGKRTFAGEGGSVINQGNISAGYAALLGETVRNEGVIAARLGTAALAAGDKVTLDFNGDALLSVQVDEGALRAQADNRGLIAADGGTVLMTARAKDALLDTAVNNRGVIRARTLENRAGKILLLGDMASGTAAIAGTLDASAPEGGDGGFIETSAAHVSIADGATITTKAASGHSGKWLIDPVDFTVAASGGDMTGAALSNALQNSDVEIQSTAGASGVNGDVNIKDTVSWNQHILTLNAQRDINIASRLNASGAAGLFFKFNQADAGGTYNINAPVNLASTGSFRTQAGSAGAVTNWTIITALGSETDITGNPGTTLQGIWGNLGGHYVLGADIDANSTALWNGGKGFTPIGESNNGFTGSLDGLGHVIDGLAMNDPNVPFRNIGLFGYGYYASFSNLGLTDVSIKGGVVAGGLVGKTWSVTISNGYVTGSVSSSDVAGGLIGVDVFPRGSSSLINVYSTADVTATVPGTGGNSLTGLAGGLAGQGLANIENSYATGTVTGGNYVGGLVGNVKGHLNIRDSYFAGTVKVNGTPYTVGAIAGGSINGLLSTLTNVYWNSDTAGTAIGVGAGGGSNYNTTNVAGLTTAQMRIAANWAGFNFVTAPGNGGWVLLDGVLPLLASEWSPVIHNAHQLQLMALDKSASYTLANDIDASATNGKGVWLGSSFASVGDDISGFTGKLDGHNHRIDGLTILRGSQDYVGLFGVADRSSIRNLSLTQATIHGANNVGILVGWAANSQIGHVAVDGSVVGGQWVGGLAGYYEGSIDNSHAAGSVTGTSDYVGGLVGKISGAASSITESWASSSVLGATRVGGLVGANGSIGTGLPGGATISGSYATGAVSGIDIVGGLLGSVGGSGTLTGSYATGSVHGGTRVGGLVGSSQAAISSSYATGAVSGTGEAGGLVGYNFEFGGSVSNSFASGTVSGSGPFVAGLVGRNRGLVAGSFWNTETSGTNKGIGNGTGAGATGLDNVGMGTLSNFTNAGWDISATGGEATIWRIYEGSGAPLLRRFLKQVTLDVDLSGAGKTYDGHVASGTAGYASSAPVDTSLIDGSLAYATDGANAVSYSTANGGLHLGGLSSGQQGYDISYNADAAVTIAKAKATVTANSGMHTYNGQTQGVAGYSVSGLVNGEGKSVLGGLVESGGSGRNAGSYAHAVRGSDGNYDLAFVDGSLTIDKAQLSIGTGDVGKVYDGSTHANGSAVVVGGQLFGADALSGGNFSYADKHAGTGKTVTVDGVTVNDGNGGGNYAVSYVANTGSRIDKARLSVGGSFEAADKTADGRVDADITRNALVLAGVVSGDAVAAEWLAAFANAGVGNDKRVSLDGTQLSGGDSGNYLLDLGGAPTAVADILSSQTVPGAMAFYDSVLGSIHGQDPNRDAGTATNLPDLVIVQCGQRLPAQVSKTCQQVMAANNFRSP